MSTSHPSDSARRFWYDMFSITKTPFDSHQSFSVEETILLENTAPMESYKKIYLTFHF